MTKITTEHQFDTITSTDELTVIKFYAGWCPDCHRIDPFMPEVEEKYSEQIKMYEIDRDELIELCQRLDIFGIPSFVAFKNGKELTRFVSKLGKSRDEIEHYLNQSIAVANEI